MPGRSWPSACGYAGLIDYDYDWSLNEP